MCMCMCMCVCATTLQNFFTALLSRSKLKFKPDVTLLLLCRTTYLADDGDDDDDDDDVCLNVHTLKAACPSQLFLPSSNHSSRL
ncbi:hypothetical protein B0T21DRAFT_357088 [Apiosordaria backusii]|uniref:Uncharacterized protein n=1 Tax=Apiosordaria backusii TaxID=314023 RepID=A0AA40K7X0_9PEZI|nr:hypothetical protein B0T21DRAFT_357088 [Apiosordaria backusii]